MPRLVAKSRIQAYGSTSRGTKHWMDNLARLDMDNTKSILLHVATKKNEIKKEYLE